MYRIRKGCFLNIFNFPERLPNCISIIWSKKFSLCTLTSLSSNFLWSSWMQGEAWCHHLHRTSPSVESWQSLRPWIRWNLTRRCTFGKTCPWQVWICWCVFRSAEQWGRCSQTILGMPLGKEGMRGYHFRLCSCPHIQCLWIKNTIGSDIHFLLSGPEDINATRDWLGMDSIHYMVLQVWLAVFQGIFISLAKFVSAPYARGGTNVTKSTISIISQLKKVFSLKPAVIHAPEGLFWQSSVL